MDAAPDRVPVVREGSTTSADRTLTGVVVLWFMTLVAGSWLFAGYWVAFYGRAAVRGAGRRLSVGLILASAVTGIGIRQAFLVMWLPSCDRNESECWARGFWAYPDDDGSSRVSVSSSTTRSGRSSER